MKTCEELQAGLLDHLDHPEEPLAEALEAHLRECEACASFYAAASKIDAALVERLAGLGPTDQLYTTVRRKALGKSSSSLLYGVSDVLNWCGALVLAVALARIAGVDITDQGLVQWIAVLLLPVLAMYPGWLFSLAGKERPE